jgi:hypothetical protein
VRLSNDLNIPAKQQCTSTEHEETPKSLVLSPCNKWLKAYTSLHRQTKRHRISGIHADKHTHRDSCHQNMSGLADPNTCLGGIGILNYLGLEASSDGLGDGLDEQRR